MYGNRQSILIIVFVGMIWHDKKNKIKKLFSCVCLCTAECLWCCIISCISQTVGLCSPFMSPFHENFWICIISQPAVCLCKTQQWHFFCAAQSLPSNPTHVLKNKDKRGGWLIANNPVFWSSKAVVGLSDNFGWSITINTNKIKCVGGRVEGWGVGVTQRPFEQTLWSVPPLN